MELISLFNAGIIAASIQASAVLWDKQGHKGICLYLLLIAIAALFNIIESISSTPSGFLFTPVFQLLFGPAFFLACDGLTNKKHLKIDYLHFLPAIISILFINFVQVIIAVGTEITRTPFVILRLNFSNFCDCFFENRNSTVSLYGKREFR